MIGFGAEHAIPDCPPLAFIEETRVQLLTEPPYQRRGLSRTRCAEDQQAAVQGQPEDVVLVLVENGLVAQSHLVDDTTPYSFPNDGRRAFFRQECVKRGSIDLRRQTCEQSAQRNNGQRAVCTALENRIPGVPFLAGLRRVEPSVFQDFDRDRLALPCHRMLGPDGKGRQPSHGRTVTRELDAFTAAQYRCRSTNIIGHRSAGLVVHHDAGGDRFTDQCSVPLDIRIRDLFVLSHRLGGRKGVDARKCVGAAQGRRSDQPLFRSFGNLGERAQALFRNRLYMTFGVLGDCHRPSRLSCSRPSTTVCEQPAKPGRPVA